MRQAAGVAAGFSGLQRVVGAGQGGWLREPRPAGPASWQGYGELVRDPEGVFDLPTGFSYKVISKWGDKMDDGLLVPGMHDGMAAFAGPEGGQTVLVRNHEIELQPSRYGAFGWKRELLGQVDRSKFYDYGHGRPLQGGTTTLVYDTKAQRLERHFLSLAGTGRNCAGGPTPWNSWLTCEEWTVRADDRHLERDHGYIFEVPARTEIGLTDPVPLKAMGRFNHEAVAVDAASGVVYETEDRGDGLIYRFVPTVRGEMARGGRLQALAVVDAPSMDTRNWDGTTVQKGQVLRTRWIDLEGIDAPEDDLRERGFAAGAARFARGEGMWYGRKSIFFACTNGGEKKLGQIWRYQPSEFEGTEREAEAPGRLELFIEPNDATLVENADNLTVAPSGDLFVCEDGGGEDHLVTVTPEGTLFRFGRNRLSDSELAGATFSPDGTTLFVNVQQAGLTLAIAGPWRWAGSA